MTTKEEKQAFMKEYLKKPEMQELLFAAKVEPSMKSEIMSFISYMGEVEYQYSKMHKDPYVN